MALTTSLGLLALAILGVSLGMLFNLAVQNLQLFPLSHIPGPWWTRYSSLWILYIRWSKRDNETNRQLHKKYGSIVRLAPKELSVNSPEGLEKIYVAALQKDKFYMNRFSGGG
jgi:hypothetical protein